MAGTPEEVEGFGAAGDAPSLPIAGCEVAVSTPQPNRERRGSDSQLAPDRRTIEARSRRRFARRPQMRGQFAGRPSKGPEPSDASTAPKAATTARSLDLPPRTLNALASPPISVTTGSARLCLAPADFKPCRSGRSREGIVSPGRKHVMPVKKHDLRLIAESGDRVPVLRRRPTAAQPVGVDGIDGLEKVGKGALRR